MQTTHLETPQNTGTRALLNPDRTNATPTTNIAVARNML